MKFKVGDKVRLIEGLCGWSKNDTGIVVEEDESILPYRVRMDSGGHEWFGASELEHVVPTPEAEPVEQIHHPEHYTWLKGVGGVEVIDITSNFGFVRGNALKYLMRADHKGKQLEDLKKARWYVDYEIKQLEGDEQ